MTPISNKKILLGITGSIAAYKAADLASKLTQSGAIVDVIMTQSATQFVSPLTFQSVTGRTVFTDNNLWGDKAHILHVGLAHECDMYIIAPATANTIAKIAYGFADNLLSLTALSYNTENRYIPLIIAPAMDAGMYSNKTTQKNIHILEDSGVIIIGPDFGHLASGLIAKGRMTESYDILSQLRYLFSRSENLKGVRIVITAGGTQEPIDPVRIITNHSSGKQGYALSQAAIDAGADVTLISCPSSIPVPYGVQPIFVKTAMDMEISVLEACKKADVLIMAAAVADYRPLRQSSQKIKKHERYLSIELEATTDILSSVTEQRFRIDYPKVIVGFAAETENIIINAQSKLEKKHLDMIVANDISAPDAGFSSDNNRVTIITPDGSIEKLSLMSKIEVSHYIINKVLSLLQNK
ncbi:MAG: bifunctional phosphopantothenoylcysteine decarboxylase/phosphopantothenate--cysteine ligase CoaBC [Chloroflexota bacterium]